ncbi:hypothetical protein [Leptospira noguchii]|uniref:hypothetical protein n=1 Tax=Leptospira noguchii TaxID=28182 RepID=UPI0002D44ABE|nr:hypothetical protein [Leptospira noguchii]
MSHFNYEICELRRRPVESRCIEFIIRPNFLTSNSRYFNKTKFILTLLNYNPIRNYIINHLFSGLHFNHLNSKKEILGK